MEQHEITAAAIADNDRRRAAGNVLVIPPCRHLGGGRFQNAVLDGHGGYTYRTGPTHAASVHFVIPNW